MTDINIKNGLIAKIHVAKKQLAMADDSYRAMLERVTGKTSSSAMTERQLEDVLKEFQRLGFKPTGGRAGTRKQADTAQAGMIRALWLDLYHLGVVTSPEEEALAQFCKRSCKVPALQWMDTRQADMVIRALRGWLERTGFKAPRVDDIEGLGATRYYARCYDDEHDMMAIAWKVAVIQRQMKLLNYDEDEIGDAAKWDADSLDATIEALGRVIRARNRAAAY